MDAKRVQWMYYQPPNARPEISDMNLKNWNWSETDMLLLTFVILAGSSSTDGPRLAIDPSAVVSVSPAFTVVLGPVTKDKANPFFGEDKPWDVAWWNTYPTIAYDTAAAKYRLWYNGCGDCGCASGLKTCSVVSPFGESIKCRE